MLWKLKARRVGVGFAVVLLSIFMAACGQASISNDVIQKQVHTSNEELSNQYVKQGIENINIGKFNEALSDFDNAIKLDSKNPDAYFYKGYYLSEVKSDLSGAYTEFSKAIELNPKDDVSILNRAKLSRQLKNLSAAIVDLNDYIKLTPNNPEAYILRGNSKRDLGDYTGAMVDLNKAVELKPDNYNTLLQRGILKKDLRDYSGAEIDFTKSIAVNPTYMETYRFRAEVKKALGNEKGYVEDLTKAIELGEIEKRSKSSNAQN